MAKSDPIDIKIMSGVVSQKQIRQIHEDEVYQWLLAIDNYIKSPCSETVCLLGVITVMGDYCLHPLCV